MNLKNIIPIITVIVIIIVAIILVNQQTNQIVIENKTSPSPEISIKNERIASVYLTNIERDSEISLPIEIEGQAVGKWFFEASFPAIVINNKEEIVAQGIMQAQGEWMTEEHVPFKGKLEKIADYTGPAFIVLKKDNPSGEARFDEDVRISVIIK